MSFDPITYGEAAAARPQIGDVQYFPDSGTLINKPNGEVWLRSGTAALASLYPQCAGIEHMMVHGQAAVTLPASGAVTGFAHNGAGTAVACYGDGTYVLVTTDYGASWSKIAHNLGAYSASDVCWNGTQFIIAGNDASAIKCAYSIAAAVFTAGGSSAVTGATATTARIAWDGTTALIVCGGTSAVQAATTPTGVTLTARTLSQAIAKPVITVMVSLGVNRWYISDGTTSSTKSAQSTATDGSAWANRINPNSNGFLAVASGNGYLVGGNGATLWRSTTGADGSWVQTSMPAAYTGTGSSYSGLSVATSLGITFDGAKFLIGSGSFSSAASNGYLFAYTSDLVNFTTRQIAFPIAVVNVATVPLSLGANICFLPTITAATSASYASTWYASSEYVGSVGQIVANGTPLASQISRLLIGYMRVK